MTEVVEVTKVGATIVRIAVGVGQVCRVCNPPVRLPGGDLVEEHEGRVKIGGRQ